jgi:hypothetical protein
VFVRTSQKSPLAQSAHQHSATDYLPTSPAYPSHYYSPSLLLTQRHCIHGHVITVSSGDISILAPHSYGLSTAPTPTMGESGRSTPIFSISKTTFSWPLNFSNPLPHKYRVHKLRSKLRARQSPASSVASVQTSFSPFITLRALRAHKWSIYDAQYLFLISLGIFALSISPSPSPLLKTGAVALLVAALLAPATSQFFFPFLPILTWLVFFFSCR